MADTSTNVPAKLPDDSCLLNTDPLLTNKKTGVNSQTNDTTDQQGGFTKWRLYRTFALFCASIVIDTTAYVGLESLQSSLYPEAGFGLVMLCILYASKTLSCIVAPLILRHVAVKWIFVTGWLLDMLLLATNFYPRWYTIGPPTVLVGICTGPFTVAISSFITDLSYCYAKMTGETKEAALSWFNGILGGVISTLFLFVPLSTLILTHGKAIMANVFGIQADNEQEIHIYQNKAYYNVMDKSALISMNITTTELDKCGFNSCPLSEYALNTTETNEIINNYASIYLLLGIYISFTLIAVILTCFMETIPSSRETEDTEEKSFCKEAVRGCEGFKDVRLLLFIPLFVWNKMQMSTLIGGYNKAYVTCILGMNMIGLIMTCMGVCMIIANFLTGRLGKYIHRNYHFLMAAIVEVLVIVALIIWEPSSEEWYIVFVISGLVGIVEAVSRTQMNALIGFMYRDNKEIAYSFMHIWLGVGSSATYLYTSQLCFGTTVYILAGTFVCAVVCYVVLNILLRSQKNNDSLETQDTNT